MNCDQTESSNRTGVRSRSKARPKMDQARALELAVMDCKKDANDKNWSNIEKILQVNYLQLVFAEKINGAHQTASLFLIYRFSILRFRLLQKLLMPNY